MADLKDRVAIVTGASRGIGRGIALSLAGAGARVVACARDDARLGAVMAEAKERQCPGEILPETLDVSDRKAIDATVERVADTYERIDKPRGEFFHTNWTGRGGKTASSTYNA